jgi:hypothetical protein
MKQYITEFINRSWTREEKVLVVLCASLIGILVGFLFSPLKKGISLFSHNGSNNSNNGNPQPPSNEVENMGKKNL